MKEKPTFGDKVRRQAGRFREYIKSWDQFGRKVSLTIDGDDSYKTSYGGYASIALGCYMLYIAFVCLRPVVRREIDASQYQVTNFDLDHNSFDPFAHGFSFAYGMRDEIPKRIGTLELIYETRIYEQGKETKITKVVPTKRCPPDSEYPQNHPYGSLSLFCFDGHELAPEDRELKGDYYSDEFKSFFVSLKKC